MSVKVRPYRNGGWEVDITFRLPDGRRHRERSKAPVNSKSGAQRWGEDRERHLVQHGPDRKKKEVPTLEEFAPRFLDGHARANQQKASGLRAKEIILNIHLLPALGKKRLDEISTEDVQFLKAQLNGKAPKTVNNVLSVLNTLLKQANAWSVIDAMPCTIRLLKVTRSAVSFYDFAQYERLVAAARNIDAPTYLIVLLGGEAGLRSGEMVGLEWGDVDFANRLLCVQRNVWEGRVDSPKGGRLRYVPLTRRLVEALKQGRGMPNTRVIRRRNGKPVTEGAITWAVVRAARRADVPASGPHRLRHTFCSHLAMRGAAPRAIQELAGHAHITTTQRYMHLSPTSLSNTIHLLERRGDMLETDAGQIANSNAVTS